MDDEPYWLTFTDAIEIHDDQLRLFGGLEGVKDANLVHSALASPINLYGYRGECDILILAIRLCVAIAKNHGFVDGNKRTATAAMIEFLAINGYDLMIPDDEPETPILGRWIEQGVAGALTEDQLYARLTAFLHDRSA